MLGCPYCVSARRASEKLQKENKEYEKVEVEWIDENKVKDFPSWCDYYYVPTIFLGQNKLFEAHPGDSDEKIYKNVKDAFDKALNS